MGKIWHQARVIGIHGPFQTTFIRLPNFEHPLACLFRQIKPNRFIEHAGRIEQEQSGACVSADDIRGITPLDPLACFCRIILDELQAFSKSLQEPFLLTESVSLG